MIFARRGIDIARYPAVLRHLEGFRTQLEPKPADWSGKEWPGRKPGRYAWYEIQDATDYWEDFLRPKVMYQRLQFHPCYALDTSGIFTNDMVSMVATNDPWTVVALNSPVLWWHNFRFLQHGKDEALRPFESAMASVPIAPPTTAARALADELVPAVVADVAANHRARRGMVDLLRTQYSVEKPGEALAGFHLLDANAFVREIVKRRGKSIAKLRPADLAELRALHEAESLPVLRREQAVAVAERRLSDAVNAAYGLTDEDIETLRDTAPPRMPPGLPG